MFCIFAWFEATNARGSESVAFTSSGLETEASSTASDKLYLRVDIAKVGSDKVALTTSDGATYGTKNGKLVSATSEHLYGEASLTFKAYTNRTSDGSGGYVYSENDLANADDLAELAIKSYKITITAGDRTRVCKETPTTWSNHKASITIDFTINEDGTYTDPAHIYYSVMGESTDKTKAEMDTLLGTSTGFTVDSSSVSGFLSSAITANNG